MLRGSIAAVLLTLAGTLSAAQPVENPAAESAESQTLEIGKPAVDFAVTGIDGEAVQLSEKLKQNKHIVLIFSRANW